MTSRYHKPKRSDFKTVETKKQSVVDEELQYLHCSKSIVSRAIKHSNQNAFTKTSSTIIENLNLEKNRDISSSNVLAEKKEVENYNSPRIQQRNRFFNTIRKNYQLDSLSEENIIKSVTKTYGEYYVVV